MSRAKVAIALDARTLEQLDHLVEQRVFPNRSQAIQVAVEERLEPLSRRRLALECAKLDPSFEQAMAEEGMGAELGEWPTY
jgi:Arc/MetJ-type ribon-helix-helix transcriptional regulator